MPYFPGISPVWLDKTNGRIGINTTAPGATIEAVVQDGSTQADITATTYNVNGGGIMHGRLANGTLAAPTKVLSGQIVGGFGARAYHGGGAFQTSSPASIHMVAAEDQEATAFGSYLRFLTTPIGSTVRQERVLVTQDGTLWAHDTATYNPLIPLQTKPVADMRILASSSATSGANGSSVGAICYGSDKTAGFRGGVAGGTPATPTATPAQTIISYLGGHVFDGIAWSAGTRAFMSFRTAEESTPTAQGTYITWETTPIGSTVRAERVRVSDQGYIGFGVNAPTSLVHLAAGTTARSQMRFLDGVAPASPNDGDCWREGSDLKIRFGTTTYTLQKA